MLCQRLRTVPDLAIFACAFATLILLGGCGSGTGDSPDQPSSDETISGHSTEVETPAPSETVAEAIPSVPPIARPDVPAPLVDLPPLTGQPTPPSPFSENPLREGTDDSPAAPEMAAPVSEPGDVTPSAETAIEPTIEAPAKPATKGPSKDKHSDEEYDPVAENGEIFVGWEKPKVALLISGRQDGYLEPCGCAGLDRMKGGLTRRHSLFKKLKADGWPVFGIDCGGLVKGFGRQPVLKFHMSVDAMEEMGYNAIALGKSDLRLGAGELFPRVASTKEKPSLFVSANVGMFGFDFFDSGMQLDHRIDEVGGVRVGVTSVLGTKWQRDINDPEITMADPETKLREVLPKMKGQCDLLVLLAHATMEESEALAESFPEFDIVVTADGAQEPPDGPEHLPGNTMLVQVSEQGMYAIVLGIYDSGKIEYQRVPLDSRFPDSPDMKAFMRQYQEQLRADGLAGLGIRAVPHPQAEELGRFVGSKKCESCHELSYETWKKSGHADAWKTLVELDVPRTHDPECISCHVIGWHPTEYFPYETGFLSKEETPELIDVGCETCHGPGGKHVAAENGIDEELQKKLQKAVVVTKEQMRDSKHHWCLNCHDLDNSPDFDFDEYWPKIEHFDDVWEDEE